MPNKPKSPCKLTKRVRKRSVLAFDAGERLRLILESARDFAIFTTDTDGIVTTWNDGAERLLGYKEKEIVGCNGDIIFTPEDRERGVPQWEMETALEFGRAGDDRWHMRKDGSRFWGSGVTMALKHGGRDAVGLLKVMRDLTGQKLAEEKLKRTTKRLRDARDSLERRVGERTEKYRQANAALRDQMAARQRLERIALEAAEREQRRIGQDLHDTLCQHVAGLTLLTKSVSRRLKAGDLTAISQLDELAESLRHVGDELREVTRGLYPSELERNGLMGGLQDLCRSIRNQRLARCRFICAEPVVIADPHAALHLYRIAQESVTNAIKHAHATAITISLARNSHIYLEIKDDGRGFDPDAVPENSMGLQMMRYRANVIGAQLTVSARPGEGTAISCVMPGK